MRGHRSHPYRGHRGHVHATPVFEQILLLGRRLPRLPLAVDDEERVQRVLLPVDHGLSRVARFPPIKLQHLAAGALHDGLGRARVPLGRRG